MTPREKNQEATEEKRRSILLAVERVIAEKGALGVTMKSVAAEAKVSHGLLHYYFASKEEMMLEMMRYNTERLISVLWEVFSNITPGQDAPRLITQAYRRMHRGNPEFFNVFAECWPLLWTSTVMQQGFKDLFLFFRKGIESLIKLLIDRAVLRPKLGTRETAIMICALSDGIELQLRIRPQFIDDEDFWEAYECTLGSLFAI